MSLIASLFGKKKEPEKTTKPINRPQQQQRPVNQNPFKNLGELAKEFQQQQQTQMEQRQPKREQQPRTSPVVVAERQESQLPDRTISRTIDRDIAPKTHGRLSVHQGAPSEKTREKPVINNIVPTTEEELVRAIIFTEILGPPKSKR